MFEKRQHTMNKFVTMYRNSNKNFENISFVWMRLLKYYVKPSASNDRHLPPGDNMFRFWNMSDTVGFNTRSTPATIQFSQTPSWMSLKPW